MTDQRWDGDGLLEALRHAAAVLHSNLDEVNALNVYPVPDGDTGSNMLATVQAAVAEAEDSPAGANAPRVSQRLASAR